MRRIGNLLLLCVLLGFGWNVNGAWAFTQKPALPSSKETSKPLDRPRVLSVTEENSARTPHTKHWFTEIKPNKSSSSKISGYTEIRPGLHVLTPDSEYQDADPTLILTRDGAEAKQLTHPVHFQQQLSYDRPTLEQGDPKTPVLEASPALIVYRDLATNRSVVLARLQPSSLTFQKNIATYKDAFDHLRADVRYTVRAGNLEQDILLYEKPLKPSAYGLNDDTTVLAVMTRVFSLEDKIHSGFSIESPSTHQTLAQSKSDIKNLMTPHIAGAIVLEKDGKAVQQFVRSYVLSDKNKTRQPVHKRLVTVQGLHFLAEEIPASYFQKQNLPDAQGPAMAKHTPAPFNQLDVLANSNFDTGSKDRLARVRSISTDHPVVIDFISVTGVISTDFTFEQGETYLVSGPVTMTGVTTFEGGATIKFDAAGSLDVSDPVFNTTSSNWAVFTSKDDDSVGEVIAGSTGSPSSYPNALTLGGGSARYVQIRYADEAILFFGDGTLTVQDSEFFAVGTPVNASSTTGPATLNLNNLLIVQGTNGLVLSDNGTNALAVNASNLTLVHLTGVGFSNTMTAAGSSLSITDSLFVDLQGAAVFSGTAPAAENYNAFYQTPETGSGANNVALAADPILTDWFLDQTSPVINAGSDTGFNTGLYHYTTDENGAIEANSQTDIGYHFPPDLLAYSMLALDSMIIQQQTTVHSGKFGVNFPAPGTDPVLQVTQQAQTEADASILGDRVFIEEQAVVEGDVLYNHLTGTGTINGTQTTPLALPLFEALPVLQQADLQGTEADVLVAEEGLHVLAPGKYGTVTVSYKATLELTGGLYEIESLVVVQQARVNVNAPAQLRIQKNLDVSQEVYFGPASGSDLSASDIDVHVEGSGVTGYHVNIGQTGIFIGHVLAPNGTFRVDQQNQLLGHVIAKDIIIEQQNAVDLQVSQAVNTVAAPLIMPPGGSFFDAVTVDIFTITSGATIHFTTDGSIPTTASPVFTAPFTLTDSATVKAIAVRDGFNDSTVSTAIFTVTARPTTEVVTFDPVAGIYFDSVTVTLSSATPGATIHFTTDGSAPTNASPVFTVPINLTASATIQAFATFPDFVDSAITSAAYTIDTTPSQTTEVVTFDPAPGTYQDFVFITLSTATEGAQIFYTLDGSDPTSASTLYEFSFSLNSSATVKAIAVKAGLLDSAITGATYTIEASPPGTQQLIGRILDANSQVNDNQDVPIAGVTVSLLNTGISAVSDANGNFVLNNVLLGEQVLDLDVSTANAAPDGSPYAGFREKFDIFPGINVVDRPFFLPRIDISSLTTVDPDQTTVVTNPNIGVSFSVAPHTAKNPDGTDFTGQLSISEVPEGLAPAAMPEFMEPGLLITIQPVGVTFSTPAPITFPNIDQFPVNAQNEYDLWSLDPDAGQFIVVGINQVSADGTGVDTVSGGIIAADWHAILPPQASSDNSSPSGSNHDPNDAEQCVVGSTNVVQTGELMVKHDLVSYRSFGTSRGLRFVYDSLAADPRPIVSANAINSVRATVPPTISTTVELNGESQSSEVFIDTSSFSESFDEDLRVARQMDATSLPTGRYPYRMKMTSNFLQSRVSSFSGGSVLVNNEIDSPYGAGWTLAGVQKLHVQEDGGALITDGTGGSQFFGRAADVSEGLVGYWPFEDGASITADVTGNHPGTLVGPVYSADAAPNSGSVFSLSFSQGKEYVEIADAPDLSFSGPEPTSMSIWFKAAVRDTVMHMIGKRVACGASGFNYQLAFDARNVLYHFNSGGGPVPTNQDVVIDQWMHMAYTYDGARFRLFIDGVLKNDVPYNLQAPNDAPLLIGDVGLGCPAGNSWVGLIDEVRMYNRVLTDSEISTLADDTNSGTIPGEGIVFASPPGDVSRLVQNLDGTFTRTLKGGTQINFDANGFHTSTVDRNGNTTAYAYDGGGKLASITDAAGLVTSFTYDANGKLDTVTDPASRVTDFDIDANGDLIKITAPDGTFRQFAYDSRHLIASQTSKRNFLTTYAYDFAGRNIGSTLPDGSTRQASPVQAVGLVDPASGFGTEANPALVVRPSEAFATFTDGNGNITRFEVDQFGKSKAQEDPLNRTTGTVRDGDGNPIQITRPNGAFRTNTWDARGNLLTTIIKPNVSSPVTDEVKTFFEYEPVFNNVTSIIDPEANLSTINYDANGNLIETIDALLTKTKLEYNDLNCPGKVTKIISAQGLLEETTLTRQYDPVTCNLVGTIDHLTHETLLEYDSAGNTNQITDAKLRVTRFEYDSMNQLVKSIDATNSAPSPACSTAGVTCFTYDEEGNTKTLTDAKANVTSWDHDALNRTTKRTDPLGNFETYQYDGQGNLRLFTDRKGQVIELRYDVVNQLKKRTMLPGDPNEEVADFDYDVMENMILATDTDSSITAVYDFLNRIKEVSTTGSPSQPALTLKYTYDKNGNRKTLDDGINTATTNYVYDALNSLTTLTTPDTQAFDFDHDVLTRRKLLTLPNGITTDYQYDALGQLKDLSHKLNTVVKSSFGYTYDPVGNRETLNTVRSNVAVAQTNLAYHYDDLNQLDIATRPLVGDPDETFQYDPVGNRELRDGQAFMAVHNSANQLSEDEDFAYFYDLNGNLIQKTDKVTGEVTDYAWDVQDQLIKIEEKPDAASPPIKTVEFMYDALSKRIQKILDGNVIAKYIYDREDILLEYDSANILLASYTHGPGIDEPLRMKRGGVDYFYNADGLGSIAELTDSSGIIVQSYIYDSFGNFSIFDQNGAIISPSGGITNPFTYTGREFDPETGLYYYRARYYDSRAGRFINEDPISFGSGDINFYRYALNDPINSLDPAGLNPGLATCALGPHPVCLGSGVVAIISVGLGILATVNSPTIIRNEETPATTDQGHGEEGKAGQAEEVGEAGTVTEEGRPRTDAKRGDRAPNTAFDKDDPAGQLESLEETQKKFPIISTDKSKQRTMNDINQEAQGGGFRD